MELPEELLIEILVQLPVKSILRFKCVCKYWLSVMQSPQLVKRHLHLSSTRSSKLLHFHNDSRTETHVVSVLDNQTLEKVEDLEWPPFLEEEDVEDAEDSIRRINIFGPVNGIYCIHRSLVDEMIGTLTLWNPTTRESKHIHPQVSFPSPLHLMRFESDYLMHPSLRIGFGFDRTNNDYKVVVICHWAILHADEDPVWQLRAYNHASDTWKNVYFLKCTETAHPVFEGANPPFPLIEDDPPISHCLLNGVFHWACSIYYVHCRYSILAFDMTTDALQLMKGPPISTNLSQYWSMWVLKENIAAVSYTCDRYKDTEVWMMMEYGVEDSWAMFYSIRGAARCIPVGIPFDDRIFFEDEIGQLVSLGFDNGHQVEKHGVYGIQYYTCYGRRGSLGILKYVESLATLKPCSRDECHE